MNSNSQLQATRDGFGKALFQLVKNNRNIFAVSADLSPSLRIEEIRKIVPEQFIECGVAEQNLVSVATGLALSGKIPFACSFAEFLVGRAWEQIRLDVCYNNANVKLVGSHAGLATGEDGASHQILEDIALTRVLPHMTVFSPCDAYEAYQATLAASKIKGPVYLRLARPATPLIFEDSFKWSSEIFPLKKGKDIVIFATGPIITEALEAAKSIDKDIAVLNVSTIKPLDKKTVLDFSRQARLILTLEDHQITGGLGSAIAEVLAEANIHVPLKCLGIKDSFGESGNFKELWKKYGIDREMIVEKIKEML
jgi:transketolase